MVEYKKFKVGELFDIHPTKSYKMTNRKLMDNDGKVAVLTNTSTNNGVGGWSDLDPTETNSLPMITFSDTTTGPDTLFVQTKPYIGYSHVQGMYSKIDHHWADLELLYVVVVIKAGAGTGWSYATKFNRKLVSNIDILLPVTSLGQPDFEYMAQYIRQIELEKVRQIDEYLKSVGLDDTTLSGSEAAALTRKVIWKKFRIGGVFNIRKGSRLIKANQLPGNTVFVGSSADNHGITGHIGQDPIFEANTLTVSYNGSVGNVFYQTDPYWASDDINVLTLKDSKVKMTPEIGNYLATCLKMAGKAFGYNRKWNVKRMTETNIMLPVTSTGEIDFDYMQNYIRAIEKQTIKNVVKYRNDVINTTQQIVDLTV